MPTLNLSPAASLHYFGSSVGLLGAVAERGFSELADALRKARENADAPHIAVALAHARYALENKDLYRAIHDPRLWQRQYASESTLRESAKTSEQEWVARAMDVRAAAFKEYAEAVGEAQKNGMLRRPPSAGAIAHLLALLVDGYMFQHLEEQAGRSWTVSHHLNYVRQLLELVSKGLDTRD